MAKLLRSLFKKKEEPAPASAKASKPVTAAAASGPIHVGDTTFEELVLNASLPSLVDFWAPWCGPCRMVAPIVEELAQIYHGRAQVAKVNTDDNSRVATDLAIVAIPTLVFFKGGREVDRVVGYAPRHVLEEKLNVLLG